MGTVSAGISHHRPLMDRFHDVEKAAEAQSRPPPEALTAERLLMKLSTLRRGAPFFFLFCILKSRICKVFRGKHAAWMTLMMSWKVQ